MKWHIWIAALAALCITVYAEEEEEFPVRILIKAIYYTVISEWCIYTYAGRDYKVCKPCIWKLYERSKNRKIRQHERKNIYTKRQFWKHAKNIHNWCHLCLHSALFKIDRWIYENEVDIEIEFEEEMKDIWSESCEYYR